MIGKTLGHYRVVEKLGAGGMGEVYRARDEHLQRDVAIKVLPSGTLTSEQARKRFRNEALALSRLNHTAIEAVYDFDTEDEIDFLVMEYVPGTTLSDYLALGPLPEPEVIALGVQIATALEEAHKNGVVHRDLKLANIILTPKKQVKVLDFGLAKLLQPASSTAATESLTETHGITGTLPYMAPEQLLGQAADFRSDIWALGVVLYEMTVGERPFQGQTGFDLSSAILNQVPQPLPAAVPMELRRVIERCLEKEPGRRHQQAGDVRAALEAIQGGAVAPRLAWGYRLARHRWLSPAAVLAVIVAVVVTLVLGKLRGPVPDGAAKPKLDSLAVLPFENLSGDPDQSYLAEGIHEALITNLAKLSGLRRVIARQSVMRYQKTQKPLAQVSQELGVDAVITGSVLRSGNRIRVTAHLINGGTEEHLWSDSFERELRDVLSLENEIVSTITRKIELQLTPQEKARLASARAVDPEAYEAYLKGMFYFNKFTPEGFEKGRTYLQQAIEKAPADPFPYAGLALGYSLIGHEQTPESFPQARAAALKALELDETLAEAREALAEIKLYGDWDWAGALEDFRRVLEINPNMAQAHAHYSWYLQLVRPLDEARAEMKRAQELDPLTPLWSAWLGWQFWEAGQYDDAIDAARKSLELNPNFPVGHYILGAACAQKGMYKEAVAAHQKLSVLSPAWKWPLGHTFALYGRRNEARKVAAELEKEPTGFNPWGLAEIYTALGKKDTASRWLEVCLRSRSGYMPWIWIEVPFKPLHDDPRFHDLLGPMNLPQKATSSTVLPLSTKNKDRP